MHSEETEARKAAVRGLYALGELYLSRGTDLRFEYEINQRAEDPVYLPVVAQVMPEVRYHGIAHPDSESLRKVQ